MTHLDGDIGRVAIAQKPIALVMVVQVGDTSYRVEVYTVERTVTVVIVATIGDRLLNK